MDAMTRYVVKGEFDEIARFYEEQYGGQRKIRVTRTEADGFPSLAVGTSPKADEVSFGALVVMVDPATRKKRKPLWHILVTARA